MNDVLNCPECARPFKTHDGLTHHLINRHQYAETGFAVGTWDDWNHRPVSESLAIKLADPLFKPEASR